VYPDLKGPEQRDGQANHRLRPQTNDGGCPIANVKSNAVDVCRMEGGYCTPVYHEMHTDSILPIVQGVYVVGGQAKIAPKSKRN
jgi:hypothetical protein